MSATTIQLPSEASTSRGAWYGHLWTVAPAILARLRPPECPSGMPFRATVPDSTLGTVRLSGILSEIRGSDTIVVIVHGLAGSAMSPYCARAAQAAAQAGFSSLRLSLRGADGSGEDIFHGGSTEDLRAALSSPWITRYARVLLLGYSVGGHIVLRAAVDPLARAGLAIPSPWCPVSVSGAPRNTMSARAWRLGWAASASPPCSWRRGTTLSCPPRRSRPRLTEPLPL